MLRCVPVRARYLVPRRIHRSLLPASSLASRLCCPRRYLNLACLHASPRSQHLSRCLLTLPYCHRHHLHGELLMCGARPRLRGVLKALPPPRVRLAVPRVAHMAEEPVVARRPRLMKAEEDDGGATQRTSDQRPKPVTQELSTSKVYCVLINHASFIKIMRVLLSAASSPYPPSSQQPCAARAQTSRDHAYSPRGPKK